MTKEDIERGNFILELYNKFRQKYNIAITIYIIIFVAGYTFFFTSNIWKEKNISNIVTTQINSVQRWNSNALTLLKWEFSEKTNEMEVVFSLDNTGIYDVNYQYSAVYMSSPKKHDIEKAYSKENLVVLHIKDIPKKWGAIRIDINDGSKIGSIYASEDSVEYVDVIKLKTFEEYMIVQLENSINYYKKQIQNNYNTIDNCNDIILNSYTRIQNILDSMNYQTALQNEQSQKSITTILQKINSNETTIKNAWANIEEYALRINNLRKKMNTYIKE